MRVFSVPISVPFLRTVVSSLLDGRLVDGFEARKEPARLADATLYLPTRRAMRVVREIFLDEMAADAVVLPRIVALGDIDEDELAFADEGEQFSGATPLDIPPRLGELERRLTLAQLVAAWAKGPVLSPLVVGGPASTLALAGDLARLIDDMVTRGVDWSALDGLVPDMLDRYWQHSLEFLRIARIAWPGHLAEINRIEPAARRDLLIAAEARRLTAHPHGPVIAAGSTGSMPATAKFLHAVASLPHGAVVLPGLDTDLDEDAWRTHRRRARLARQVRGASGVEPSAICHARAAGSLWHQAQRRRHPAAAGRRRPRSARIGIDAAIGQDGSLARPVEAA